MVGQLKQALNESGISLLVDTDTVRPRQSFETFINEIATGDCVFLVLSQQYFRSFFCMLEFVRTLKHGAIDKRVSVILAEGDFNFNVVRRGLAIYWQDRVDRWHENDAEPDEADACGTLEECQEILAALQDIGENDSLFSEVAYSNAVKPIDDEAVLTKWVQDAYLERIRSSKLYKPVSEHLKVCGRITQQIFQAALPENISDDSVARVGYLITLPLPELISLIRRLHDDDVQRQTTNRELIKKSQQELSMLLRHLLPILYSSEYGRRLREQCTEGAGIVALPYSTDLSAEILMASVDGRVAEFIPYKISEESGRIQLAPGRLRLRLPPENSGEGLLQEVEDDLSRRMGLDTDVQDIAKDVDNHLFDNYATKQPGVHYSVEERRLFAQDVFWEELNDNRKRYYWIFPMHANEQRWQQLAAHIREHYPEITLLSLIDNKMQQREENRLFRGLHNIISNELLSHRRQ